MVYDCVIVGAGVSGLQAANALRVRLGCLGCALSALPSKLEPPRHYLHDFYRLFCSAISSTRAAHH